jgi:2-polyprenyl-3-methyl-5-hydroxy-6-metoxy-1,4-benzoquinol methylase
LIEWVPEGFSMMDVGCGPGLFVGLLAATGRSFCGVGFDALAGAIRAARIMAGRAKDQGFEADLRFEHLDVRAPWPGSLFHVVSIIDVMHHVPLPSRRSVLELARATLQAGGSLSTKTSAIGPDGGPSPTASTTS